MVSLVEETQTRNKEQNKSQLTGNRAFESGKGTKRWGASEELNVLCTLSDSPQGM